MKETSSPGPKSLAGRLAWAIWAIAMAAMAGYSIYATVDSIQVYRAIPSLMDRQTLTQAAWEKYGVTVYYISHIRMIGKLTKRCEKLKESGQSYSGAREVALYRRFQELDKAGERDTAGAMMDMVFEELANEKNWWKFWRKDQGN